MELHDILKTERKRRNISQSDIVFKLMDMGVDVSSATISRVEKGWIPSWPVVTGYCTIFGWSLAELEKRLDSSYSDDNTVIATSKRRISKTVGRYVPVCSWVNAGSWGDSPSIDTHNQDQVFVPGKLPKNTFSLRVSGTSMENCGGKYHFPDGSLILVNPDAEVRPNDFVVAMDDSTQQGTFKQLVNDCGEMFLKPLNPQYPVMPVTESTIIKGVVFRQIDDRDV